MRTAEAVSSAHPDKVCDQISDAILDECLRQDPESRVAIETTGGHGIITITGELTTRAFVDMRDIALNTYRKAGYSDQVGVQVNIVNQSPDIAMGVNKGGAGDQGIMIGYACDDNEVMIPQELYLARWILNDVLLSGYGPDGKSQVTLDRNGKIKNLVISVQHPEGFDLKTIQHDIDQIINRKYINLFAESNRVIVNGTGKFVLGGFNADTGLTGRKIVQDAYGPQVPVGGGAFSGKDPSKVDRSAAYMARKIAVDYLKKYNAKEVLVKLAYAIGIAEPVMATAEVREKGNDRIIHVNLFEMGEPYLSLLSPKNIIEFLDLKRPIYYETAKNGHFGNKFIWEV